jgi:hypothetical protein
VEQTKELLLLVQEMNDCYDNVAWHSDTASLRVAYPYHIKMKELLAQAEGLLKEGLDVQGRRTAKVG